MADGRGAASATLASTLVVVYLSSPYHVLVRVVYLGHDAMGPRHDGMLERALAEIEDRPKPPTYLRTASE
jgi:hypothetical protein